MYVSVCNKSGEVEKSLKAYLVGLFWTTVVKVTSLLVKGQEGSLKPDTEACRYQEHQVVFLWHNRIENQREDDHSRGVHGKSREY